MGPVQGPTCQSGVNHEQTNLRSSIRRGGTHRVQLDVDDWRRRRRQHRELHGQLRHGLFLRTQRRRDGHPMFAQERHRG